MQAFGSNELHVTTCIDADWIIGRHQYDGRTLVVYGYDTTLWVSETVEEIEEIEVIDEAPTDATQPETPEQTRKRLDGDADN